MMPDLTPEEREILLELLSRELSDLGPEIHHTDDREYREELKQRREAIRQLMRRLEVLPTSS